jgi:LuxR family maltose regulon positive regulatory protein
MSVRPGQHDAQLSGPPFSARSATPPVRTAARSHRPRRPASTAPAMVDRVLSEISATGDPFDLVIDDLKELNSAEAAEQLTSLLTRLPPRARDRGHPPRPAAAPAPPAAGRGVGRDPRRAAALHRGGDPAARGRCGIALPDEVAGTRHQRTEGWAAGLRLALLSLAGHPDPERFVAEFSGSDRTVAEMLQRQHAHPQHLRQAPGP